MILKENFAKTILVPLENQGFYINWDKVEKCEKIADDYVVDVLNWYNSKSSIMDKKYIGKTSEELLEMFKKEKGL